MRVSLLILALLAELSCFPQRSLQLIRVTFGKARITEVFENEPITLKVKGSHKKIRSVLMAMNDSMIMLKGEREVKLKDIRKVIVPRGNRFLAAMGQTLASTAVIYLVIDGTNNLIFDRRPVIHPSSYAVAGSMLTASLLMKWFSYKRFRINGRTIIRIINN
jgi:hypothetical protein